MSKTHPIDAENSDTMQSGARGAKEGTSTEREVQTELHPVPYNRDENYVWNLWDLRRKAIELANLRRKKTSSAQTAVSYHRFNIASQRYEDRQKSLQTTRSTEMNTKFN
jgi:hypothetical protein